MEHDQLYSHQFEVFYDGECPLCTREIALLKRLDKHRKVLFTDIASPSFDAASVGRSWETLMARIHGKKSTGELVEGVEVFRELYSAIGFSRLVSFSRLPGISGLLDSLYLVFAKNRLRVTGRCKPRFEVS